jgi:hypothetical protein
MAVTPSAIMCSYWKWSFLLIVRATFVLGAIVMFLCPLHFLEPTYRMHSHPLPDPPPWLAHQMGWWWMHLLCLWPSSFFYVRGWTFWLRWCILRPLSSWSPGSYICPLAVWHSVYFSWAQVFLKCKKFPNFFKRLNRARFTLLGKNLKRFESVCSMKALIY